MSAPRIAGCHRPRRHQRVVPALQRRQRAAPPRVRAVPVRLGGSHRRLCCRRIGHGTGQADGNHRCADGRRVGGDRAAMGGNQFADREVGTDLALGSQAAMAGQRPNWMRPVRGCRPRGHPVRVRADPGRIDQPPPTGLLLPPWRPRDSRCLLTQLPVVLHDQHGRDTCANLLAPHGPAGRRRRLRPHRAVPAYRAVASCRWSASFARTWSMSRARTAEITCSRAAAGSAPGWENTTTPSRMAISVGIE